MMVTGIRNACGCTELDWEGGLLRPGETRMLSMGVYYEAWGRGLKEKPVLLQFGDGSALRLAVRGEGVTPEEEHRIELSQNSFCVDMTGRHREKKAIEVRVAGVKTYGPSLEDVQVAGGAEWLSARIEPIDAQSGELWATIDAQRAFPLLDEASNRMTAEIKLSTHRELQPAVAKVELVRRDWYRVDPVVLRLTGSDTAAHKVHVSPNDIKMTIAAIKVGSCPHGLQVEPFTKDGEGWLTIRVQDAKAVPAGYQEIDFTVESSGQTPERGRVLVQLVP